MLPSSPQLPRLAAARSGGTLESWLTLRSRLSAEGRDSRPARGGAQCRTARGARCQISAGRRVSDRARRAKSHGSWLVDAQGRSRVSGPLHVLRLVATRDEPAGLPDDRGVHGRSGGGGGEQAGEFRFATVHLAEFVDTFVRVLGDPEMPYLFFIEGGALAVENALKCAFDWKSRQNEASGRSRRAGDRCCISVTRSTAGAATRSR